MGLIKSFSAGVGSYWISMLIWHDGLIAFWAGILGFFFVERITYGAHKRKLIQQHNILNHRLLQANSTIHGMSDQLISNREQLGINNDKLGKAIVELERRDAVGSPATRELIKRQDEAIATQSSAIAENAKSHERALEMFSVLERAVCVQGEQGRKMLDKMSEIVQRLALEPRNTTLTMRDSVLVQGDGKGKNPLIDHPKPMTSLGNSFDQQIKINGEGNGFTALINPIGEMNEADKKKFSSLLQTLL